MSVMTHPDAAPLAVRAYTAGAPQGVTFAASHLTALKRFFKIALGFTTIVLVMAGILALKFAAFYPRAFH